VRLFFEHPPEAACLATHEEADKGQGRIEIRRCEATDASE
jgi:hypothetical protein